MNIPIVSIMVTLIFVALIWWVISQLAIDAFIVKVVRVVIVVLCVLYLMALLTGNAPPISFNMR